MEELLSTILVPVISIVVSTLISTLVGAIIKHSIEKRLDKSDKERRELAEYRANKDRQDRKTDVEETLRAELKPTVDKINNMSELIGFGLEGTVTLLRESMKQTRDQFAAQNYVSASDYASWQELYSTYKKLGGNHFKEYVDA